MVRNETFSIFNESVGIILQISPLVKCLPGIWSKVLIPRPITVETISICEKEQASGLFKLKINRQSQSSNTFESFCPFIKEKRWHKLTFHDEFASSFFSWDKIICVIQPFLLEVLSMVKAKDLESWKLLMQVIGISYENV